MYITLSRIGQSGPPSPGGNMKRPNPPPSHPQRVPPPVPGGGGRPAPAVPSRPTPAPPGRGHPNSGVLPPPLVPSWVLPPCVYVRVCVYVCCSYNFLFIYFFVLFIQFLPSFTCIFSAVISFSIILSVHSKFLYFSNKVNFYFSSN